MTSPVPGPIAVIADYNLLERLDPAGPGDLFRARDTRKGRTVAVRLLPEEFVDSSTRLTFMERARGLSTLSHPNVIPIFFIGDVYHSAAAVPSRCRDEPMAACAGSRHRGTILKCRT